MEENRIKEKSDLEDAGVKVKKWEEEWLVREDEEKNSWKEEREQHDKQIEVLRDQVI